MLFNLCMGGEIFFRIQFYGHEKSLPVWRGFVADERAAQDCGDDT